MESFKLSQKAIKKIEEYFDVEVTSKQDELDCILDAYEKICTMADFDDDRFLTIVTRPLYYYI